MEGWRDWKMISQYPLHSCWDERPGKLINLSFSYLSTSAALISLSFLEVSSDIGHLTIQKTVSPCSGRGQPGLPWHGQEVCRSVLTGAWAQLLTRAGAWRDSWRSAALSAQFQVCVFVTLVFLLDARPKSHSWRSSLSVARKRLGTLPFTAVRIQVRGSWGRGWALPGGHGCQHEDFTYEQFSLRNSLVSIKSPFCTRKKR